MCNSSICPLPSCCHTKGDTSQCPLPLNRTGVLIRQPIDAPTLLLPSILLLAAAVWIRGVVQNLLWRRDIARFVPLSTCLTHSSAECSLPSQGRDWSSRNDKEKRTSGRTSWKDTGAYRDKKTTKRAEIRVSTAGYFFCVWALKRGKRKLKECPRAASFSAVGFLLCEFLCCLKGSQQCVSQRGREARSTAPLAPFFLRTLFFILEKKILIAYKIIRLLRSLTLTYFNLPYPSFFFKPTHLNTIVCARVLSGSKKNATKPFYCNPRMRDKLLSFEEKSCKCRGISWQQ